MKICPICNTYVSDDATSCSNCGVQFIMDDEPQQPTYDPNAYSQQTYDPNAYAQQGAPQQPTYTAQQVSYTNPPAAKPKKKNSGVLIAIAATVFIVLAGIGFFAEKFATQSGGSGAGNGTGIFGQPVQTIEGTDIFAGERFNEMLWGYYEEESYDYDGSWEASKTFREGMKYQTVQSQGKEYVLSVLPITIHAGRYTHFMSSFVYEGEYYNAYTQEGKANFRKAYMEQFGDLTEEDFLKIEKILRLDVVETTFVNEEGVTQRANLAYSVKNNTLSLYEVEIDEKYNIIMGEKPLVQCEFLLDGGKLVLASQGVQRNYYPNGYKETDKSVSFSGYAYTAEERYKDIEGFSVYGSKDSGKLTAYLDFTDGNSPIDPVMTLDEKTGNFTLKWEQRWSKEQGRLLKVDDPQNISGTLVPCTSYAFTNYSGFFMFIDGVRYDYLMSEDEYEERQSAGLENAEKLNESEKENLVNTKRNLLAELEKAFKAAGISAKVDYESGKIALEASFMFATNSHTLSDEGQKYLDAFMSVYTSVILKEEYSAYISKIVVEGHTDTSGSYSLNQKLSQKRADAVAQRCISNNPQIAGIIEAVGCSYDYPVYNKDGSVNMSASRRVTFSFAFTG